FAAAEESVFLTKFARHVTILIREEDFTCAAAVAEPARKHEKITIITDTVVEEVSGKNGLDYIRYRNTKTGEITEYHPDDTFGVFVFAGYAPATDLVKESIALNEQGYIVTDPEQRTNIEGVYAAGDVCIKPLRQVVTATGDGALAATALEKYVAAVQRRTGIAADPPTAKEYASGTGEIHSESSGKSDALFSDDMKTQLRSVFDKMQQNVLLKLYLDERPVSDELENYMQTLAALTDKLTVRVVNTHTSSETAPYVQICLGDGTETGLAFHGVPGGHEFTSFVLGIYNAAGPGQAVDEETAKRIRAIQNPTDVKVLVSLSCTMCPDTVLAAQQIAAKNPNVRAEVYDLHHFEVLKKRHNVMSVPCVLINDSSVSFGKKNIGQILALIGV
ncbi:MAG: FAD-dependent oxidoreductase, partial [Clostridia bacterium]|nr:FAD-dependent oxidoreductase [Clostridia bacterium]